MASAAAKFFKPIRHSISYFYYCSSISTRKPIYAKTRTWLKQLESTTRCSKLNIHKQHIRNGHFFISGSTLGVTIVVGSMGFSTLVTHAMDGEDILVDDRDFSDVERDCPVAWTCVRKLWLPVFFLLTVLVNWDHPIILITKLALFLLTTKPSPMSVYVFVEQLCRQSMHQKPYLYFLKSLYANKVEVQDYKLFCLATVEVNGQKLTLLGVLGGWWALPLSQRAFSVFWDSVLY